MPGKTRHLCWYLDTADYLIGQRNRESYSPDEPAFLFPFLAKGSSGSGTKISNFLKDLLPGGSKTYAKVAVSELPSKVSAGGIRPGACNLLICSVPVEFAVQLTGHDCNGASSFFEYIDCTLPLTIPPALPLAGWPAPPWGQLCKPPSPPSLLALQPMGVTVESLDQAIDAVFRLIDPCPTPKIRVGGSLRPVVYGCFAALIMHHKDRIESHEMRHSLTILEALLPRHYIMIGPEEVRATIYKWGNAIRLKYDADNARLVRQLDDSGVAQLGASIHAMGEAMGKMSTELTSSRAVLKNALDEVAALRRENELRSHQIIDMHGMMCALMQHHGIAPEVVEAFKPATPAPPPDAPILGSPRRTGAGTAQPASEPAVAAAVTYGSIVPLGDATEEIRPTSIAGMNADEVFLDFMYAAPPPSHTPAHPCGRVAVSVVAQTTIGRSAATAVYWSERREGHR
jgi:hypothetical protein